MPALGGTGAPKGRVSRESETSEVWRPHGSGYWFGDQAALT